MSAGVGECYRAPLGTTTKVVHTITELCTVLWISATVCALRPAAGGER
jgi:hypothetical protein